jgi:ribosome-associated protein
MELLKQAGTVGDSETLARRCVEICEERKAENLLLFDMRSASLLADFYLICSGTSGPHLRALVNHLSRDLAADGSAVRNVEGTPASGWVIIDYGTVLVHVLEPARREFYRIEEFWGREHIVYEGHDEELVVSIPSGGSQATTSE